MPKRWILSRLGGTAVEKTKPHELREIPDGASVMNALDRETARMMDAHPRASLRASEILVTLHAISGRLALECGGKYP